MAAPSWKLIQAFIREATENPDYTPVADISVAYAKLRAIQRGHFTSATATDGGGTVIQSTVGTTAFSFAIPQGLDQGDIIAIAESALQLIEGKTVDQARALLQRVKRSRANFSTYCPS